MDFEGIINSNDVEKKPKAESCYSDEFVYCTTSEDDNTQSEKINTNLTKVFFEINEINIEDLFDYKVDNILINRREIKNLLNKHWLSDTVG